MDTLNSAHTLKWDTTVVFCPISNRTSGQPVPAPLLCITVHALGGLRADLLGFLAKNQFNYFDV